MADSNYNLAHIGVKGMRWGVRKASGPSSSDAATARKLKARVKKNGLNNLTNDELKRLNTRMDLEAKYNKVNPGTARRGQALVAGILATVGTATAVYNLNKNPIVELGATLIRRKANPAKFAIGP